LGREGTPPERVDGKGGDTPGESGLDGDGVGTPPARLDGKGGDAF